MPLRRSLRQPHRDYYEIIKVILQNVYSKIGGCKPFEVAYRCQLNWPQFTYYRDILLRNKLLIPSNGVSIQCYEITPKGERYLHLFAELENGLRPLPTA
jgi:predicted transcriptional regulator